MKVSGVLEGLEQPIQEGKANSIGSTMQIEGKGYGLCIFKGEGKERTYVFFHLEEIEEGQEERKAYESFANPQHVVSRIAMLLPNVETPLNIEKSEQALHALKEKNGAAAEVWFGQIVEALENQTDAFNLLFSEEKEKEKEKEKENANLSPCEDDAFLRHQAFSFHEIADKYGLDCIGAHNERFLEQGNFFDKQLEQLESCLNETTTRIGATIHCQEKTYALIIFDTEFGREYVFFDSHGNTKVNGVGNDKAYVKYTFDRSEMAKVLSQVMPYYKADTRGTNATESQTLSIEREQNPYILYKMELTEHGMLAEREPAPNPVPTKPNSSTSTTTMTQTRTSQDLPLITGPNDNTNQPPPPQGNTPTKPDGDANNITNNNPPPVGNNTPPTNEAPIAPETQGNCMKKFLNTPYLKHLAYNSYPSQL
ncbi:MAG: hypothetical protein KDK63_03765 [Chlamydiia bacterium]|nr:hypothetical protein [Chlamydiia bacterium]